MTAPPLVVTQASKTPPSRHMALGHCVFGGLDDSAIAHPDLTLLGTGPVHELWLSQRQCQTGRSGDVSWQKDGRLLFGSIRMAVGADMAQVTRALYAQLFACVSELDYPHMLRIWNYLPDINAGSGDTERYKQFCTGRAQAYAAADHAQTQFPAATAIGTQTGHTLLVYFLAATSPGRSLENPRQTSAPAYPRQYGPSSPQFARAMLWPADAPVALLLSGTASIVGHTSRHVGDVEQQLAEIWRNLDALRAQAGAGAPTALRVYLRSAAFIDVARAFLARKLAEPVPVVYLQADICRSELLVEIEGVYAVPTSG